jgi:hypothetical protein
MQGKLSDLIRGYSTPYSKRLTQSPSDAREYVALVDFHVKVALTLLAAYGSRTGSPIKLGDTPGMGDMLGRIKIAKKWDASQDPVIVQWRLFAESFLGEFSKNIHDGKSFKAIRDELSHGTPIPAADAAAAAISAALRQFSEVLAQQLELQLDKFMYRASGTSIEALCGSDVQELSPLWDFSSAQGVIGVYSTFDTDGVYYLCPVIGAYRNPRAENTQIFRERFLAKDPTAEHFGQFVYEITRDIAGFSEDRSPPSYDFGEDQNAGEVFVTWTQPNSLGNVHRVDRFRRGQDDRHEWFDPTANAWAGYSAFLRETANWNLLARRLGIELDEQDRRKTVAETGNQQPVAGLKMPTVLKREPDSQQLAPEVIDLKGRADAACVPSKNFTTVFFIVGDAGMGKTDFLLALARERARVVEAEPESALPLYLFVSSTGRVLSNLDDAINTSLSVTRILDSHSAKALCRNGLLVLIVDGFDELLGSSGYDNPLGSLEGWFRDLRGRGVMVASARSAYYMTRYRRALSETTDLNVEHTVAEIQPWARAETKTFLLSYGIQDDALTDLGDRDWRLLTIPFFAKAFAIWCVSHHGKRAEANGIFQVVVEQYLDRESKKILDQNNAPILTIPELQVLFGEFSEMMHLDGKRELEQSDLELCATIGLSINDLDRERPGLRRRLTSLCGLAVGELVGGNSKFGFTHEVISDCFLSLSLQRRCSGGVDKGYIANFFARGTIHPTVIEWFVAGNPGVAHSALEILLLIENTTPVWQKNVGSLWTALLDHSAGTPPHLSASGLEFQTLKLSKGHGSHLRMSHSRVDQLLLSKDAASVDIQGTPIRYLEVDDASTLTLLQNVSPELIQEIKSPTSYCDTTPAVRAALENAGVIERQARAATLEWQDIATYFIEALVSRPDAPIVVFTDNFEADGNRLGWTARLGLAKWTDFLHRLTQYKLASWESLVSKGRPKSRLVFHVAPAEIARRQGGSPAIEGFWGG